MTNMGPVDLGWNNSEFFYTMDNTGPTLNEIAGNKALSSKILGNLKAKETPSLSTSKKLNFSGGLMDIASSFMSKDYSGKRGGITAGMDAGWDTASNVAMTLGPVGMIVGSAMKAGKLVSNGLEAMGVKTDKMTTGDAIFGSTLGSLTVPGLVNNIFNRKTQKLNVDKEVVNNSSYTGTGDEILKAKDTANKRYGLFSSGARRKANRKITQAKKNQLGIRDILDESKDRRAIVDSSSDMYANRNQLLQSGYFNNNRIAVGKAGMKFIDRIREYKEYKASRSKNLIPEGALHARNHHIDSEYNITSKGIPVLLDDGGELSQVAEIERGEIIFREEVTEKLLELYEEGTDEAAIEAGKLLVKEILYNTQDNTNIIQEVE
nr:MAG TPA: hypothetical protein [Caudoviricetes sp.]